MAFGVDRDEADAIGPAGAVAGGAADLLGGGVLLPSGEILPNGARFFGMFEDGSTYGGRMQNVIGQGGIASANDAIEFLLAGASAVGLGTALFYDPLLCPKVNAGIAAYLERAGMSSVAELTGALASPAAADCGY